MSDDATRSMNESVPSPPATSVAAGQGELFPFPDRKGLPLVLGLTLACLVPFLAKAYHIDDTLFLAAARRILAHPFDPFGFVINWEGTPMPMASITKNPPLTSYYIALVTRFLGGSEPVLHAAFLIPALAVVCGTFLLARRFCREPFVAAAAAAAAPVFLVSATSVMCDVMMLSFFVWALVLWIDGLERDDHRRLALASILAAAAFLTKFFGLALLPLFAAYAIARGGRAGRWAWHLVTPAATAAAYLLWTRANYGSVPIVDAATYSVALRTSARAPFWINVLVASAFTGGCLLPAALLAAWRLRRVAVAAAVALGAAAGIYAWRVTSMPGRTTIDPSQAGAVGLHMGLFAALGLLVLLLAASEARRYRDPGSLLLVLWTLGTFVFTGFLNWTINGRSLLPMAPAVAILAARRFEMPGRAPSRATRLAAGALLGAAAIVGLAVARGDFGLANSGRAAALAVMESTRGSPGRVFFQGHWGFQYYMEQAGAFPLDLENPQLMPGDRLAVPQQGVKPLAIPAHVISERRDLRFPVGGAFTTLSAVTGAGFYSHFIGPLPFRAGPVPDETYRLVRLAP